MPKVARNDVHVQTWPLAYSRMPFFGAGLWFEKVMPYNCRKKRKQQKKTILKLKMADGKETDKKELSSVADIKFVCIFHVSSGWGQTHQRQGPTEKQDSTDWLAAVEVRFFSFCWRRTFFQKKMDSTSKSHWIFFFNWNFLTLFIPLKTF